MTPPTSGTVALHHAIHHANTSAGWWEVAIRETDAKGGAKHFLQEQANRCRGTVKAVLARVKSPEAKQILQAELRDEFTHESMGTIWAALSLEGREDVENYAKSILNG